MTACLRTVTALFLLALNLIGHHSSAPASSQTNATTIELATITALFRGDAACVYRPAETTFFCDTARNGGDDEYAVRFGTASDLPLLGDVDGDGRDDPCVFRPAETTFFCDTAHNGGDDEYAVRFGTASDLPLLGSLGRPFGTVIPLVIR